MAFEPSTGALRTVADERDEIGDDVPPDYLTSVKEGGFYGWPYSYWGKHVDERVQPQRPDLVAKSSPPTMGWVRTRPPSASPGTMVPPCQGGMFIGQHGSWNRGTYSGFKVIFVPFKDGRPSALPIDVLTGFLKDDGSGVTYGRPVGVSVDGKGAILVADDTGNTVWRVSGNQQESSSATPDK